jgi:hypothetical protein
MRIPKTMMLSFDSIGNMKDYSVDSYWGGASLGSALVPSTPMQAIPHALLFVAAFVGVTTRRKRFKERKVILKDLEQAEGQYGALEA